MAYEGLLAIWYEQNRQKPPWSYGSSTWGYGSLTSGHGGTSGGTSDSDGEGHSATGSGGGNNNDNSNGDNSDKGSNDLGERKLMAMSNIETPATNQITNDGITVAVFGSESSNIMLDSVAYGTAQNINAVYSSGFNALTGNYAPNLIMAGAGNTALWGGADFANDILVDGAGYDTFYCGKSEGSDCVLNASAIDTVCLYDTTLSDIVAAVSDGNGTVALQFNTGNVLMVNGTDLQSATFALADGSRYAYNRVTQAWQTA